MQLEVNGGTLRVVDAAGATVLVGHGEVRLGDGHLLSTADPAAGLSWRIDGPLLRLVFHNASPNPVKVEQLRPLVAPSGYRRLSRDRLRVASTGWQSWSRSNPALPFAPNFETAGPPIRGPYLPHRGLDSQVEAWMTVLEADGCAPFLLGFLSGQQQLGTLELRPTANNGHALVAATELEGIPLAPGGQLVSEPLLFATDVDEPRLRQHYAEAVAQAMPLRPSGEVLTGWCSWYQLYTAVTERDVLRNAANLAALHDRLPMRLIQLDDGFQHAVGDWLELNDKFPSGMPALVAHIRQHGFLPGLWLAPFLLSERSHTYAAHPDWVIRDEHGQPLNALYNWGAPNFALDTTHPAALEYVLHAVHTAVHDWGYRYLKLDFLYAAALRGQRHDPTLTSVQAYRQALERIRAIAGSDCFILASGAPLLPSIGLVDGMRIGSDVAAYWAGDNNSDGPALSNALRATLARGWFHGRWWHNDPDCVIVRAHDTQLTLDEVRAWAAVVALSGGMVFVGDDVSEVEPARLELLARLLPPSGQAAEVTGPPVDRMPERLHLRVRRPWGEWSVVGIANWGDAPVPIAFEPSAWDLPAGSYHLFDLWSGDYLGCHERADFGQLQSHALRLLAVHAELGRPRVVGSTGHLLGDVLDLAEERWDPTTRELVLTPASSGPAARRAELVVADKTGELHRVAFSAADGRPMRLSCPT
jgi:alpha-galactosidase